MKDIILSHRQERDELLGSHYVPTDGKVRPVSNVELGCKDLLVLTWNGEGEEKYKNVRIKIKPLWKWLLELP